MDIQSRRNGETTHLTLAGELTIYAAAQLKEQLLAPLGEARAVEMDLAQVGEIDSAGLQLLILARREADAAGKDLRFGAPSQPVRDLLELYGLTAWFGALPPPAEGEEA